MTSQLEKEFFRLYNIEERVINKKIIPSTGECIEEELGYPEVTDNLLLQLICQLNYYDEDMKFHADNYRELREEILENLIWIAKHNSRSPFLKRVKEVFN